MLEKYLIEHCSPTLASLKTANLFSLSCSSQKEIKEQLDLWNAQLKKKGVVLTALRWEGRSALIYVCRRARLQADLQKEGVAQFLSAYGYSSLDAGKAIRRLRERLGESDGFPHEIGLFLGYPLGDVVGFIQNAGKNSKCIGCWKVYCNECEALKTFAKFKKCRDVYCKLWRQGRTVLQLTVAA